MAIVEISKRRQYCGYLDGDRNDHRRGDQHQIKLHLSEYSVLTAVATVMQIEITTLIRLCCELLLNEFTQKKIEVVIKETNRQSGKSHRWGVGNAISAENLFLTKLWHHNTRHITAKYPKEQQGQMFIWLSSRVTDKTTQEQFIKLLQQAYKIVIQPDQTEILGLDFIMSNYTEEK